MSNKKSILHRINLLRSKYKRLILLPAFPWILGVGILAILLLIGGYKEYSQELQKGIAEELIRFHVIANSDSKEDQELKLEVKDVITKETESLLEGVSSVDEARLILSDKLKLMENLADETISQNGFTYKANATLENNYFPLKVYGDIALPPGEYESVRIELGNASGENWWCIMFPPLCFVDSTYSVVPDSSKDQLQDVLTEEEYDEILIEDDELIVKPKFKILTFLNDFLELD